MGVSPGDLHAVLRLYKLGVLPKRFSVADIGAQQLSNSVLRDTRLLQAMAEAFNVPNRDFGAAPKKSGTHTLEHLPESAPFAKDFWEWLGCEYVAIDIDRSPHVIRLDLNFDDVPHRFQGKFNLVTNFGTTEHVANQVQAMKVIHDLTAVGGVMIHNLPAQGYMNHGLINYNPKFFWMLARSCRYHWYDMQIAVDPQPTPVAPAIIGELRRFNSQHADSVAKYAASDAGLFVVMQKREAIPYVPPIDIHTGGIVDDDRIKDRYWSVFDH